MAYPGIRSETSAVDQNSEISFTAMISVCGHWKTWTGTPQNNRMEEQGKTEKEGGKGGCLFVGWLFNVPATCECISGTDLLRQFYVLPH